MNVAGKSSYLGAAAQGQLLGEHHQWITELKRLPWASSISLRLPNRTNPTSHTHKRKVEIPLTVNYFFTKFSLPHQPGAADWWGKSLATYLPIKHSSEQWQMGRLTIKHYSLRVLLPSLWPFSRGRWGKWMPSHYLSRKPLCWTRRDWDDNVSLDSVINLAICLDNLICKHPALCTRSLPEPITQTMPMQLSCTRLSADERERRHQGQLCFYCHQPDHIIHLCLFRQNLLDMTARWAGVVETPHMFSLIISIISPYKFK